MAQITRVAKNKYQVRVFYGRDSNGKVITETKTITGTRDDAKEYATAKMRQRDLGQLLEPQRVTVEEYLEMWLDKSAKLKLTEGTHSDYKKTIKRYIDPIKNIKLIELKNTDIQKLYGDMPTGARTIRYLNNILNSAFKQAIVWNYLRKNPCDGVTVPVYRAKEVDTLTVEEVKKMLEHCWTPSIACMFAFAVSTGMRPQEYCAIRWCDIDLEKKTATVRRAIERIGSAYNYKDPKTQKSKRTIPLPDEIVKRLKEHRKTLLEKVLKSGVPWGEEILVFPSRELTPFTIHNVSRMMKAALKRAKLPTHHAPKSLRHTFATLLLSENKTHPKIVAELLGHSSVRVTLDTYSHAIQVIKEDETEKLAKVLFG